MKKALYVQRPIFDPERKDHKFLCFYVVAALVVPLLLLVEEGLADSGFLFFLLLNFIFLSLLYKFFFEPTLVVFPDSLWLKQNNFTSVSIPLQNIKEIYLSIFRFREFFHFQASFETSRGEYEQRLLFPLKFLEAVEGKDIQYSLKLRFDFMKLEAGLDFDKTLQRVLEGSFKDSTLEPQESEFIEVLKKLYKTDFLQVQQKASEDYRSSLLFTFENSGVAEHWKKELLKFLCLPGFLFLAILVAMAAMEGPGVIENTDF